MCIADLLIFTELCTVPRTLRVDVTGYAGVSAWFARMTQRLHHYQFFRHFDAANAALSREANFAALPSTAPDSSWAGVNNTPIHILQQ